MGVPAIGTRVGGVPETIRDGETGVLVPAHDPASLAQAISRLLDDRARLRAMATAARDWVRAAYSVEAMGDAMLALYRRLLGERTR